MTAANACLLALVAVNCATIILNLFRVEKTHARWYAAEWALYLLGCACSLAEPTLIMGFALLSAAAVTGLALSSRLYLMPLELFGDGPW